MTRTQHAKHAVMEKTERHTHCVDCEDACVIPRTCGQVRQEAGER